MMSKKILSVVLTIAMIATVFCMGAVVASADTSLHANDQVWVTLYVKNCENVGGLCNELGYDSTLVVPVSDAPAINSGSYIVNMESNPISWNQTFDPKNGYSFNNEELITFGFKVIADTTADQLKATFTSDTWEFFDVNYNLLDGNEYVYTTFAAEPVDSDSDSEPVSDVDSEPVSDVDSEPVSSDVDSEPVSSDVDSETASDVDSETVSDVDSETASDVDSAVDSDVASDTDSASTSSVTSSENPTSSTSDSDAKNTQDNASSKTSSSTTSNKTTSTSTTATVQTAGTIAVISLVVILMAAGAVVLFAKKKAEQE